MKQKPIPKNGYEFTEAYNELSRANQRLLRDKIINELKIRRGSFYNRMKGVVPSHPEFLIIKQVFAELGIQNVYAYERQTDEKGTGNS